MLLLPLTAAPAPLTAWGGGLIMDEFGGAAGPGAPNPPHSARGAMFHGTTILSVRSGSNVVMAGDGQVTMGDVVMKHSARKIRKLYKERVLAGFAGAVAVLAGLVLGAIAAFIIDRQFRWAGVYALAAAILAFFGFIHGVQLEFAASPLVALGYLLMGVICLFVAWREEPAHERFSWQPPIGDEKVPAE